VKIKIPGLGVITIPFTEAGEPPEQNMQAPQSRTPAAPTELSSAQDRGGRPDRWRHALKVKAPLLWSEALKEQDPLSRAQKAHAAIKMALMAEEPAARTETGLSEEEKSRSSDRHS
jgi:hypothetical protein